MLTRAIPSSGAALPVIGCGTWLGFDVGATPAAMPERGRVLDELFRAGGTVVDSSPMYGSAEQVVGDLLDRADAHDKAFLATKVWTTGRRAGIAQMEQSFARLRTRRIDLLQVHNLVDWKVHLATLHEWKMRGRIGYVGVTHYTESAYTELEEVMRGHALDFVQFNYSIVHREAEKRLLPLAAERGIAVLVNLPFGGGRVLGRLRATPLPTWAKEIGCMNWNQVLLKFVLSHPAVTCAIPGTSSADHMRENALAGVGAIPPRDFWDDKLPDV
jgi:aryl-alcohol dehydrogenase-like predicted oxidoreductase